MDEKEAEARPVMGTIFLVIMRMEFRWRKRCDSRPRTSDRARSVREDGNDSYLFPNILFDRNSR